MPKSKIAILVLNQSPISAVFPIVGLPGNQGIPVIQTLILAVLTI